LESEERSVPKSLAPISLSEIADRLGFFDEFHLSIKCDKAIETGPLAGLDSVIVLDAFRRNDEKNRRVNLSEYNDYSGV